MYASSLSITSTRGAHAVAWESPLAWRTGKKLSNIRSISRCMPRRSETGLNLIRLVMAIIGFRLIGYSSYSPANIYNSGANRPYAVISAVSAVLDLHPDIPSDGLSEHLRHRFRRGAATRQTADEMSAADGRQDRPGRLAEPDSVAVPITKTTHRHGIAVFEERAPNAVEV